MGDDHRKPPPPNPAPNDPPDNADGQSDEVQKPGDGRRRK